MPIYRRVSEAELLRFSDQALRAAGVPAENAAIVADNLVQGELHGHGSHGPSRLLPIYIKRFQAGGVNPDPKITIVQQSKSAAVVDGDNGPGAVVGRYAMRLAIDLAREHGSGWVTARRSTHYGAAFLFAREALTEGMIGFSTTAAVAQVAPFGGRERALGTNPLCIAVPGGERGPIILDMATSVVARGKVQLAALEGKPIPQGWALDAEGHPTTNPVAASKGSMLPLGGYKGYGLALMVEILSSVLSGALVGKQIGEMFSGLETPQGLGHFFGALDVSLFMPLDEFRARMDALIAAMKTVALADGAEEILVPGEPEARKAALYRAEGIPLAEDVIETLNATGRALGIAPLTIKG